ncbi:mycofactocin biosynthesis chaperone MftB [Streptomyces sp. NBC_00988]|uniref:mycofactocin biosynthesis chaperone MftB n=1 Tax=Streptomyces sp. NBC_00988 TaxID=2903704 RepID=UPI003864536B|nr:mycofactocin biosynthesis chaperone MftB [Streptomyces sp. NBC_00988]
MTDILDQPWELSPSVALRSESFGALAYHFGNRRLTFLKRRELVDVVRLLGCSPDVRTALTGAGVPPAQWSGYLRTLRGLASTDMIRHRDTAADAGGEVSP